MNPFRALGCFGGYYGGYYDVPLVNTQNLCHGQNEYAKGGRGPGWRSRVRDRHGPKWQRLRRKDLAAEQAKRLRRARS